MRYTIEGIAAQFPILETSKIYLNHAGISPLPKCAADAMIEAVKDFTYYGPNIKLCQKTVEVCRNNVATLIGADAHDIAFVQNTSQAISIIAHGLQWKPGDELLVPNIEYAANLLPWVTLKNKGVKVIFINPEHDGTINLKSIEKLITKRTRLLAISHVQYTNGFRIDIHKLSSFCKQYGLLLLVDAIQSLGAFPVHAVSWGVDFLAAASPKWLMGPPGIGILYVRRDLFDTVDPLIVGERSAIIPQFWNETSGGPYFLPTAQRFESGNLNYLSFFGLEKSTEILLDIGVPVIAERITSLVTNLRDLLMKIGFQIDTPDTADARSGILSCKREGIAADTILEILKKHNIKVAVRSGRVRFSPHFYNSLNQIREVVALLKKYL